MTTKTNLANFTLGQFLTAFNLQNDILMIQSMTQSSIIDRVLVITNQVIDKQIEFEGFDFIVALNLQRICDLDGSLLQNDIIGFFAPQLTHIGQNVFKNSAINHFFAQNLRIIGKSAFENTPNLHNLCAMKLRHIREGGFKKSGIKNLYAPELLKIDPQGFAQSSIENIYSEVIELVGQNCFADCVQVKMLNGFQHSSWACGCKVCCKCQKQKVFIKQKMAFVAFTAKTGWVYQGMNLEKIERSSSKDRNVSSISHIEQTKEVVKEIPQEEKNDMFDQFIPEMNFQPKENQSDVKPVQQNEKPIAQSPPSLVQSNKVIKPMEKSSSKIPIIEVNLKQTKQDLLKEVTKRSLSKEADYKNIRLEYSIMSNTEQLAAQRLKSQYEAILSQKEEEIKQIKEELMVKDEQIQKLEKPWDMCFEIVKAQNDKIAKLELMLKKQQEINDPILQFVEIYQQRELNKQLE